MSLVPSWQAPLIELFNKHKDGKGKQAKLKSPSQLQELLDITRQLLADMDARDAAAAAAAAAGGQAVERDEAVRHQGETSMHSCSCCRHVLDVGLHI